MEMQHDPIDGDHTKMAQELNKAASLAARRGEHFQAVQAAEKCLAAYERVVDKRDETLATYKMMLAYVLAEAGRFDDAVSVGEGALSLFVQLHGRRNDFVKYRAKDIECMRRRESRSYLDK